MKKRNENIYQYDVDLRYQSYNPVDIAEEAEEASLNIDEYYMTILLKLFEDCIALLSRDEFEILSKSLNVYFSWNSSSCVVAPGYRNETKPVNFNLHILSKVSSMTDFKIKQLKNVFEKIPSLKAVFPSNFVKEIYAY